MIRGDVVLRVNDEDVRDIFERMVRYVSLPSGYSSFVVLVRMGSVDLNISMIYQNDFQKVRIRDIVK